MADISFSLNPKILVGTETVNRIGNICSPYGGRILIITEQVLYENKVIDRVVSILNDSGVESLVFDEVPAQATAEVAESAAELARGARCSAVIGLGGLKTQVIARLTALLTTPDSYLFDILDGQPQAESKIPYIAIPTTGRDPFLFTDYFLAVDPRDRSIRTIQTPTELCDAAIIDGGLSESLSGTFASTTAFDGFCVAVEAYCSQKANVLSDALLEPAIRQYAALMDSYGEGKAIDLIVDSTNAGLLMSLGCALSSPGIGTALSYALNGKFPVAKSWCSTVLLPYIMERLVSSKPERMAKIADLMGEPTEGCHSAEAALLAVEGIRRRMGLLKVPGRLKEFDLVLDRLVPIAENAKNLNFIAYSPRPVSTEDVYDLLKQAY